MIPSFKNTAYFFGSKDSCQRIQESMFKLGMRFIHTDKGSPREIFDTSYAQGYVRVNSLYQMSIHYAYPRDHYTIHCDTNLHKMAEEYVKAKKAKRKLRKVEKMKLAREKNDLEYQQRLQYNAPESGGWIKCDGKFCPVTEGIEFEAIFRDPRTYSLSRCFLYSSTKTREGWLAVSPRAFEHSYPQPNDVMYYRLTRPVSAKKALWQKYSLPEGYVLSNGKKPDLPDDTLALYLLRRSFRPSGRLIHLSPGSAASIDSVVWGEQKDTTIVAYKVVKPEVKYNLPEGYILSNGVKPDLPGDTPVFVLLRIEFNEDGSLGEVINNSERFLNVWGWNEQGPSTIVAYKVADEEDTLTKESAGTDTTNPKQALGAAKLPMALVSPLFIANVALAKKNGMSKYGGANFIGTPVVLSIYLDAALRHIYSYMLGEEFDPVDGVPHIGAAGACLDIIVSARAAGTLIDDRLRSDGQLEALAALTPIVTQLQALHKDKNPKHYYIVDK